MQQSQCTEFSTAVLKGESRKVKALLSECAELAAYRISSHGFQLPLEVAVAMGHVEVAELLIIQSRPELRRLNLLIHTAASKGNKAMVLLLATHNADINFTFGGGATPLTRAIGGGFIELAEFLKTQGGYDLVGPFCQATLNGDVEAVKAMLDANPELIDYCDTGANTPLHLAARAGHDSVVDILMPLAKKYGCRINAQNEDGNTPLHEAVSHGHSDAVAAISKAADHCIKNKKGNWPLHDAARCGHMDAVQLLLSNNGQIDPPGTSGYSPLMFAVENGHVALVEWLIGHGGKVNYSGGCYSPLHCAADQGSAQIAELLLRNGAVISGDSVCATPLHFASRRGHLAVAEILIAHGSNVNAKTYDRDYPSEKRVTPLDLAEKDSDMAALLLRHGATQ